MASSAASFWMTDMWTAILTSFRVILAAAVVGGAATAVVAPAFDMASGRGAALHQPAATRAPDVTDAPELDFETLLLACLDSADPDSTACAYAQAKSGQTPADFRLRILEKLRPDVVTARPTTESSPEPKPEPKSEATKKPDPIVVKKAAGSTNGFETLLKQCLGTRDESSDACIRAGEASGLFATDWSAKIRGKLEAARRSDFATYFEKCLATRDIDSDQCIRAEELSGLGFAEFEAKFNAKLAAKDGTDFWTAFERCLATRDVRSDPCLRARELIGFNDADFHAKFDRYLAQRDAQAGRATATPKPSATTFDTLLRACGDTHDKTSDPCLRALVLSGLQPAEFWAKVEAKVGPFR